MKNNHKILASCFFATVLIPFSGVAHTANTPLHAVVSQQVRIQGVVKDAAGETVIGATILQKGNPKNGTITNINGQFTITVPVQATLVISCIGYVTQEIKVTSATQPLQIILTEDTKTLDEVVVVGFGVQKKVNLTGSVSTVQGKELSQRPVANATQSLQGLVPGLTVSNSSSGRPGAAASLSLRGTGNLSGTGTPYVLVDGVEMSLEDVNPNDIESISVLKDAAASSIYGARAAYGVILVTTKSGKEGKTHISYQGTMGWSSPTVLPRMANSYEFATYFNQATDNAGVARQYSDDKLSLLQQYIKDPSGIDPWAELGNTNNLVAAFENTPKGVGNVNYFSLHYKEAALKQNHNISINGGGKRTQFFLSGGLYTEDGILRFADISYKRANFSSNITTQLTERIKLKFMAKLASSQNKTPFGTGGLSDGFYHSLARFRPTVNHIDPNGHYTELTMIPYLQSGTFTLNKRKNVNLTGDININLLKGWTLKGDYTYRIFLANYEALNTPPLIPGADNKTFYKGTRSELGVTDNGSYTRRQTQGLFQKISLYTNYNTTFAQQHNIGVMAGYQEELFQRGELSTTAKDLISATNPGINIATGEKLAKDNRYSWATRGFFGRLNYDYDGKYLLEVNGRYDASSRFAPEHRWGFFPSVSVGWNIHRETFMEPLQKHISNLKLRLSYGLLGNQAGAGLYTFASEMEVVPQGNYYFGKERDMYILMPNVINPATTWEKVSNANIGLDYGFFQNRLTGTFDIFRRDTRDMLGPATVYADLFGTDAPQTNNAQMRNTGWEWSILYRGDLPHDIHYTIGGSISDAISVVTAYQNPSAPNPANDWYPGKTVGEIWGYRADGLIQTQAEADEYNKTYDLSYLTGQPWKPGDVKYRDLNGDKKVNQGSRMLEDMGDLTIIGNSTPRYQYTINGSMDWKGVSVSVMLQGVGKRHWAPGSGTVYFWGAGPFAQVTVFKEHLDYWTPNNPNAYYPNPYTAGAGAIGKFRAKTSQVSDRYLQSAAYCRLKNITLNYTLPTAWTKKIGLSRMQVFFSGENLWTWTRLAPMFDPEAIFTSNNYSGQDGKNYPMNKVYSAGLILNL